MSCYNSCNSMSKNRVIVMQYNAVFQEEDDGGYSAWVPSLPGCTSQGDTFEKTMSNIKEAIELYLETEPEIANTEDESEQKQFLVPIKVSSDSIKTAHA
jgi:predicted RNase H-like HicB family nuclease